MRHPDLATWLLVHRESLIESFVASSERPTLWRGEGEAADATLIDDVIEAARTGRVDHLDITARQVARQAVMRDISQLSSDLGLRLTSIRPDEPESIQNSVRYPLTFRVEADFAHIVRLLYELEQPPHRLWVEGIEIGPGPRGQAEPSALVHVATYTVRPASEGSDAKS